MSVKKINATKKIKGSVNKKAEKFVDSKKYLYAVLILFGGIIFALYIFEWYQVKQEEKLMTSYLISSNTIESHIKDLDSINQITQEAPSSYFIYVGYTGDEKVYNLEKELKRVIDKYKLNDEFYYIDITEIKNKNTNYLEEIEKNLNVTDLENIPVIIYVNEGKITDILDGNNYEPLTVENFEKLLELYEFEIVK